jgi:hypothetical protein
MVYAQNAHPPVFGSTQQMPLVPAKITLPGMTPITPSNNKNTNANARSGPQPRSVIPLYDSIINWQSDTPTMTLYYVSKETDITYDANNNMLGYVVQRWNGSAWVNSGQYTYTYNSNNDQTSQLVQSWNGSAWGNYSQDTFTYDSNNNETGDLYQTWNGSAWVNSGQYINTYNSNNDQTNSLNQNWIGGTWVNSSQNIFIYNANNDDTSQVYQTWNGNAWVNGAKYTYTYNSANDLTGNLHQTWNGSAWVNSYQDTFTYNSNNDRTGGIAQTWSGSAWVNSNLSNYGYYPNNIQQWTTDTRYSITGDTITSRDSTHYYLTTTGINLLSDNATIQIYPNPSGNFIHATIELKQTEDLQLRLVNMLGQTVWSTDVGNVSGYQNNILVANLPDGFYLLELTTGNGTQSREIVVSR